jgi:peptide/nickel transport system substrate-binding protein
LFASRATAARSLLPPGHWAFPSQLDSARLDAPLSRSELERLPRLTLLAGTDRLRLIVARAVAQMLNDAGLHVAVLPLDFGVLLSRLDSGDYDMAMLQMPELTEPNVLRWFLHEDGVPGEGGEGRNRARYRSREASALLDRASEIPDLDRRRELYGHLAEILADDMPLVPLWHEDQVAVVSERARDFRLSAEGRWLAVAALR